MTRHVVWLLLLCLALGLAGCGQSAEQRRSEAKERQIERATEEATGQSIEELREREPD